MIRYKDYLLVKLAEEAAEVSQAAIKTCLFGEVNGDYDNLSHLRKELLQLAAVVELLEAGYYSELIVSEEEVDDIIMSKKESLRVHYEIAKVAHEQAG